MVLDWQVDCLGEAALFAQVSVAGSNVRLFLMFSPPSRSEGGVARRVGVGVVRPGAGVEPLLLIFLTWRVATPPPIKKDGGHLSLFARAKKEGRKWLS
jgi:hypothetical protein